MYNLNLTAEQREIRDTVREFVTREIKPVALDPDRLQQGDQRFPPAVLALGSRMGLRTLGLPEALGGAGADSLTSCIVAEELAAGDVGVAATLAQTSMLSRGLFESMTDEQRARFAPQFVTDHDFHLALASCAAGEDPGWTYHQAAVGGRGLQPRAVRLADGHWVVNGVYPFVANAPVARLIAAEVVVARASGADPDEVTTLLLTPGMPGLTVREAAPGDTGPEGEPLCRWHHGRAGALVLENCRVPGANHLGAEAKPSAPERGADHGSPIAQALNLGVGRAAYEAAVEYAKLRIQGGRRIIEHESIATILAGIAIRLEVARNAVWKAAWAADHPDAQDARSFDALPLQSVAEVFVAETVHQVTLDAAEVFGAMGVMRDLPMQKYVRDALIFLHAGSGGIATRLRIAETIAGYRRSAPAPRKAAA